MVGFKRETEVRAFGFFFRRKKKKPFSVSLSLSPHLTVESRRHQIQDVNPGARNGSASGGGDDSGRGGGKVFGFFFFLIKEKEITRESFEFFFEVFFLSLCLFRSPSFENRNPNERTIGAPS